MSRLVLVIIFASAPSLAAAQSYTVSTASSLSSGRYGGAEPTRVASTSLNLRSEVAGWQIGMTLPYVVVEAAGVAITSHAVLAQGRRGGKRQRGYGDAQLRAERAIAVPDWSPVDARISAHLKVPTGARHLSTGTIDGGVALELSRQIGPVMPYVSASYRFYGNRASLRLQDGWSTSTGATITRGKTLLLASYERSNRVIAGPAPRELFALAGHSVAPGWNWSIYGSKGLNRGSADLMLGTALTWTFRR
jgi:hypothetical protein